MRALDVADLVVIGGRVLGIGTDAALGRCDIAAAQAALAEARAAAPAAGHEPGAAFREREAASAAAIALVHALLRHRPFPGRGEQVAVAAGLQFLSLNGWRARLDPPGAAAVVVEALASGRLSQADAAAWLLPRLSPGSSSGAGRARVLVSAMLAIAVAGLTVLATACSRGPGPTAPDHGARPAASGQRQGPDRALVAELAWRSARSAPVRPAGIVIPNESAATPASP